MPGYLPWHGHHPRSRRVAESNTNNILRHRNIAYEIKSEKHSPNDQ